MLFYGRLIGMVTLCRIVRLENLLFNFLYFLCLPSRLPQRTMYLRKCPVDIGEKYYEFSSCIFSQQQQPHHNENKTHIIRVSHDAR